MTQSGRDTVQVELRVGQWWRSKRRGEYHRLVQITGFQMIYGEGVST